MTIQEAVSHVADFGDLTRSEAGEVMRQLMRGEGSDAQLGGLLVGLRMKGETVEEITGFAEVMREMATPVKTSRDHLVDTCGTGGTHSGTFNISTTAAFVVAGAGLAVAKHGNRSATSKCGSADVLEALGVNLEASPETIGKCIDEIGIGFLFARTLHGAMKHVAGPRAEMKTRTIFNLLGPLTNPAGADAQVMGVYDSSKVESIARVLSNLGSRHAFVVAGSDGMDELTLAGPTLVGEAKGGDVRTFEIAPEDVGLSAASHEDIQGHDAQGNAEILRTVLGGERGPHRDIVLFNAAAAIIAGGAADDWKPAITMAAQSIDSGAALEKLEALIALSQS